MAATEPGIPTQVTTSSGTDGSWEMAVARPGGQASTLVSRLVGFQEHAATEVIRREPAVSTVTVIVLFDHKLQVEGPGSANRPYLSFVAGLQPGPSVTRHSGELQCIQIDLSPLAAFHLFGLPGCHLAGTVAELDEVVTGLRAEQLSDQLASTGDWPTRLGIVNRELNRLAADGRPPDPVVSSAWCSLARSGGKVQIADLARESGVSHGHLTRRFRQQVGITPKAAANLFRYEHAATLLSAGHGSLPDVAATCGYADQSHLTREVNRLAGTTPASLRSSVVPA